MTFLQRSGIEQSRPCIPASCPLSTMQYESLETSWRIEPWHCQSRLHKLLQKYNVSLYNLINDIRYSVMIALHTFHAGFIRSSHHIPQC